MSTYYISPTGSGLGDGSSWENAARISALPSLVDKAGPGGTVLLRADQGAYSVTSPIQIRAGGDAGASVTVKGVDGAGAPMQAEFVGNRDISTGVTGGEIFRFMNGADHLVFEDMVFRNVGTAFRFGADVQDITIRHVDAYNVQRFIEDYVSGTNTTASVTGLVVQDVEVHGFSKGAIRLQYDSSNILIEDVYGDSEKQSHDSFAMGVMLDGTVHDVVIRDTTMANAYNDMSSYWNGDGFTTEAGVYRVLFENTDAFGNTDGGYDLKSRDTVLIGASASNNKRNYRVWSDSVTIQNSTGDDPDKAGGTGSEAQVWLGGNAKATIIDSQFTHTDNGATVFELSSGAILTLEGTITYDGEGAVYSKLGVGAIIERIAPTVVADAPLVLTGGDYSDTLVGGSGDDVIDGAKGADSLTGGGGADRLSGGAGADRIDGNDGADVIIGDLANVVGGSGQNDVVDGGAGDDVIYGDNVSMSGSAIGGSDTLLGGDGADVIYGDAGTMHKKARGGADTIHGGDGDDKLYGDAGNNHWRGGNDVLYGDAGNDMLSGGVGHDQLDGGAGADTLIGGGGFDVFRFGDPGSGADHIVDFVVGTDKIGLSSQAFGVDSLDDFGFLLDPAAVAGDGPVVRYSQATGQLYWDANGGSAADQTLVATLDNHALINHDSFMILS